MRSEKKYVLLLHGNADRLLHGLTAFFISKKRVDRLRHGLTTRFFYVLEAVLNMLAVFLLSNNKLNGKIHVIKLLIVESVS